MTCYASKESSRPKILWKINSKNRGVFEQGNGGECKWILEFLVVAYENRKRGAIYSLGEVVFNSLTPILVRKSSGGNKKLSGGNEKLLLCRFPTVGIVRKVPSTQTQLPPQTSSPWWCRFPLLRQSICGSAQSDMGNIFQRGWPRVLMLDLT